MPSVVGMKRRRGVAQPEGAFGSTGAVLECADDFRRSGSFTGRRNFLIARGARRSRRSPIERSRSEEHTSELQSLMRISYAVFCLKKKNTITNHKTLS